MLKGRLGHIWLHVKLEIQNFKGRATKVEGTTLVARCVCCIATTFSHNLRIFLWDVKYYKSGVI